MLWLAGGYAPYLFRPIDAIYWLGPLNHCSDYSSLFNQKSSESWQTRLGAFLDQHMRRPTPKETMPILLAILKLVNANRIIVNNLTRLAAQSVIYIEGLDLFG